MPQAKEKRSWLKRLRERFGIGTAPKQEEQAEPAPERVLSVVYLPHTVSCMGGHVRMAIPVDFRVHSNAAGNVVLHGPKCRLLLTITAIPFLGMLQKCTASDIRRSFLKQRCEISILRFEKDFLRFSPRVLLHYQVEHGELTESSVLMLIQKRNRVYSLLFTGNVKRNLSVIESMLSTLEVT